MEECQMIQCAVLILDQKTSEHLAVLELKPSGMLVTSTFRGGIHPYALKPLVDALLDEPIYKKYADVLERDRVLPLELMRFETDRLAGLINDRSLTLGGMLVSACAVEREDSGDEGTEESEAPANEYPLIYINEVPALIEQLNLGEGFPRYAVLMYVPKDSRDGEHVNLQYSAENGVVGLDWVLLGGRNIEDKEAIAFFCKRLGHLFTECEMNGVNYLRAEGYGLAELGMQVLNQFYRFGPEDRVKLLVEGFEWPAGSRVTELLAKLFEAETQLAECQENLKQEQELLASLLEGEKSTSPPDEQYLQSAKKACRSGIHAWELSIMTLQGDIAGYQAEIDARNAEGGKRA